MTGRPHRLDNSGTTRRISPGGCSGSVSVTLPPPVTVSVAVSVSLTVAVPVTLPGPVPVTPPGTVWRP